MIGVQNFKCNVSDKRKYKYKFFVDIMTGDDEVLATGEIFVPSIDGNTESIIVENAKALYKDFERIAYQYNGLTPTIRGKAVKGKTIRYPVAV